MGGGVPGSSEGWSSRVSSSGGFRNKPKVREMDGRGFFLILYAYFYC